MFYLLLSILLNTYIGIAFVYFKKYKVDIFQAIVFNYSACVITGSLVISQFPINSATIHGAWFPWAIAMGALFISLFNIIAFSSVKVGVTITQTSNKLSLAIPVLFAWLYYHEQISLLKLIGILFAILSVLFITSKKIPQPLEMDCLQEIQPSLGKFCYQSRYLLVVASLIQ